MIEFESELKIIPHSDKDIFRVLSDLRNLHLVSELIPEDKIKDFSFDKDRVAFVVDSIGKVAFNVLEREPNKSVRFQSEKLPFNIFMKIELEPESEQSTTLKMVVESNLNPFMRGIVEKPMRDAVNRISEALVHIPYDQI